MDEEEGGRRCARCDRHIYDFSLLTEAQATEVKRLNGGSVCRKITLDADGAPIYAQRAMRAVVRTAAGVVLSVALAACEAEPAAVAPRTEVASPHEAPEPVAPGPEEPTTVGSEAEEPPAPDAIEAQAPPDRAAPEEPAPPSAHRPRPHRERRPTPHDDDPLVGLEGI
jgi:hypothetical protein